MWFLPIIETVDVLIRRVFSAAFIVLGIFSGVRVVAVVLRWYATEIAVKTRTALDDTLVAVLRIGIPIVAGLLGVVLLLDIFGFPVELVKDWLATHGARLWLIIGGSIIALFALGVSVPKAIERTVGLGQGESPDEVKKRADTLSRVLVTSSQVLVIAVTIFMLLAEIDVNIAPVLAGAGVAGVAIGFGAQSLIKDIIAGVFIISDN